MTCLVSKHFVRQLVEPLHSRGSSLRNFWRRTQDGWRAMHRQQICCLGFFQRFPHTPS